MRARLTLPLRIMRPNTAAAPRYSRAVPSCHLRPHRATAARVARAAQGRGARVAGATREHGGSDAGATRGRPEIFAFPSGNGSHGNLTGQRGRPGMSCLYIAGDRARAALHSRWLDICRKPDMIMVARYAKSVFRGHQLCKAGSSRGRSRCRRDSCDCCCLREDVWISSVSGHRGCARPRRPTDHHEVRPCEPPSGNAGLQRGRGGRRPRSSPGVPWSWGARSLAPRPGHGGRAAQPRLRSGCCRS